MLTEIGSQTANPQQMSIQGLKNTKYTIEVSDRKVSLSSEPSSNFIFEFYYNRPIKVVDSTNFFVLVDAFGILIVNKSNNEIHRIPAYGNIYSAAIENNILVFLRDHISSYMVYDMSTMKFLNTSQRFVPKNMGLYRSISNNKLYISENWVFIKLRMEV